MVKLENSDNRRFWAERLPTEDTFGAIATSWIMSHWELFDSDWRLEKIKILVVSKGWKALLMLMHKHWKKHHAGLSFKGLSRALWERANNNVQATITPLLEWAEEIHPEVSEDDYHQAMNHIWQLTRKGVYYEGMTDVIDTIADQGMDKGLDQLMTMAEKVKSMGEQKSAGIETMAQLSSRAEKEYGSPRGKPMNTGLLRVDMTTLGGMRKGNLWLLAGFVSQGKTVMAKEIAYNFVKEGRTVLWVSLEMTKAETQILFAVRHAYSLESGGVSLSAACEESLNDKEKELYFRAVDDWHKSGLGEKLIVWVPEDDVTADDVIRKAEAIHRRKPIDLLVVDYSELLIPMRHRNQYRIELGDTIRRLKSAAQGFGNGTGVPILLLHQISRHGYEKAIKRGYYIMSDLSETAQAERHSNVILWILQTDEMEENNQIRVGIAKNRMGPKDLRMGTLLYEDFSHGAIANMPVSEPYHGQF